MVAACAFLMLCRVIYSQDIRLKGDKTATQPSAEASPPAKLVAELARLSLPEEDLARWAAFWIDGPSTAPS